MSVYIDQARHAYRGMVMGHMIADSITDLFEMASLIGMQAVWFQPKSFPHFDVSVTRRRLAKAQGAIIVSRRELVGAKRKYRQRLIEDASEHRKLELLTKNPSFELARRLAKS